MSGPHQIDRAAVLAAAEYYRDLAFAYGDCINDGIRTQELVDDAVNSIKAGLCREFSDELYRLAGVHVPFSAPRHWPPRPHSPPPPPPPRSVTGRPPASGFLDRIRSLFT